MSLFSSLFGAARGSAASRDPGQSAQRMAEWGQALQSGGLPSFVEARLAAAASGKAPWIATMSPAELRLARGRGIRPLATVSGTCWLHYGYSWTRGHAEGWRSALARMQQEAHALGANAVVDVRMRTVKLPVGDSMDFTLLGTAVRIEGISGGEHPVVATVPALEFVRLVEADIVPVGLAIGAEYSFLSPTTGSAALRIERPGSPFLNGPLGELGDFWERIRRAALIGLHKDAERQGSGVLAHTHFGQLLKIERGDNVPPRFLGRHIVIGTVIDTGRASAVPHDIRAVVDMRDALSPLSNAPNAGHSAYPARDEEGAI